MAGFGGFKMLFSRDKTFRPKKKFQPGTMRYNLHKYAQASLNADIDLREAVKKPEGEDLNDWIAVHVVDFINRINLIYGTVVEFCTEVTCPSMSGGPKYEYRWRDKARYKRPTRLPACTYIGLLMDWLEELINNEAVFPTEVGVPFPKDYMPTVQKMLTKLFRVFVHVYIHHFDRVQSIGAEAHVNMCYKHFYFFITEFELVDKQELEPLKDMTAKICQ